MISRLHDSSSKVRRLAAHFLCRVCGEASLAASWALIPALRDSEEDVRQEARRSLAAKAKGQQPIAHEVVKCLRDHTWCANNDVETFLQTLAVIADKNDRHVVATLIVFVVDENVS